MSTKTPAAVMPTISFDDPVIQLIIFLPSSLFLVTLIGITTYCCIKVRDKRRERSQREYQHFAQNYQTDDRPFTILEHKSPSMPNIPGYYNNRGFEEVDQKNKNVTLIRASERTDSWNYDKTERRHKSTNVLTYKHRDFDEFPEYLDAQFFHQPATREPSTRTQQIKKSSSQPSLKETSSFKTNKPVPVGKRDTRSTSKSDREDRSRSLDLDSPPPSDIYDIFSV